MVAFCVALALGVGGPGVAADLVELSSLAPGEVLGADSLGRSVEEVVADAISNAPLRRPAWMSREADYLPVVDGVTRDLDAGPEFPGIRVLGRGPSVSGGSYIEEVEDLRVKAPGGYAAVTRRWIGTQWVFLWELQDLEIVRPAGAGTAVLAIRRLGDDFTPRGQDGDRYVGSRGGVIVRSGLAWRHTNRYGDFVDYDAEGRATAYGNREGLRIEVLRTSSGVPAQLRDANGAPLITFEHDGSGRIRAAVDRSGRRVGYGYSGERLGSVTDVRGEVWTYGYVSSGDGVLLGSERDPLNRETRLAYDAGGRLSSMTRPDGSTTRFGYDYDPGKGEFYLEQRLPPNRVVEQWFNEAGQVLRISMNGRRIAEISAGSGSQVASDEHGNQTRFSRDSDGRLVGVTRPDGGRVSVELHPELGLPTILIGPTGAQTEIAYDARGNITRYVEARGTPMARETRFTHDAHGQLETVKRVLAGGVLEGVASIGYDAFGNPVSITDPAGIGVTLGFDAAGNLTSFEDGRGNESRWIRDPAGAILRIEQPGASVTRFEYDAVGNRTAAVAPGGARFELAYDPGNRLAALTDPLGRVWRYRHSASGRLVSVVDPENDEVRFEWDRDDRLAAIVAASGAITRFEYVPGRSVENPFPGLLVRTLDARFTRETFLDFRNAPVLQAEIARDGRRTVTRWSYDAADRLIETIEPDGRSERVTYDALGRVTRRERTGEPAQQILWDLWGRRVEVGPVGQPRTILEIDALGRLVREQRAGGGATSYAYDVDGNLRVRRDGRGQRTEYAFDSLDQLVGIDVFESEAATAPAIQVSYGYDGLGRLLEMEEGGTRTVWSRDPIGRVLGATTEYPGFTLSHAYTYHRDGTVASYTGPDGKTTEFAYGPGNELLGITLNGAGTVSQAAFERGLPGRITYPGGAVEVRERDDLGRLSRWSLRAPNGEALVEEDYHRDLAGRITDALSSDGDRHYEYDDAGRLAASLGGFGGDERWVHDALGNRRPSGPAGTTWLFGPDGEISARDGVTYGYDGNGNRMRRTEGSRETIYRYDARDRLVEVSEGPVGSPTPVAAYGYDAIGRRLWKEVSGARTYFHYTQEGLAAEVGAAGQVLRSFVRIPGVAFSSAPLAVDEQEGGVSFGHADALDRPRLLTNTSGGPIWSARYRGFGSAQVEGAGAQPFRLPGQSIDPETGLHWSLHRPYDPELGQYLAPDPLGIVGGHRYDYAAGDPLNADDALGLLAVLRLVGCAKVVVDFGLSLWRCVPDGLDPCNIHPLYLEQCAGCSAPDLYDCSSKLIKRLVPEPDFLFVCFGRAKRGQNFPKNVQEAAKGDLSPSDHLKF